MATQYLKTAGLASSTPMYFFSSQATLNQYHQFQQKYEENLKAFHQKTQQLEQSLPPKKPLHKAYQHPFHSQHHPLNFSSVKLGELFYDFVGPEQVSPHYENFLMSRKYLMTFLGLLGTLTFLSGTYDVKFIAQSMINPLLFWSILLYFYVELRKSWFKPLLMRFYRRVSQNDIYNMEVYYHENMQHNINKLIQKAKEQLQYFQVHKEFQSIKAESINIFMANEHANLQRHIQDRALNLLRHAQQYETINKTKIIQEIIENASAEVDKQLEGPNRRDIMDQMFDSALIGLSEGKMEYKNDPILPIVQNYIKENAQKYTTLSPEEQQELVTLKKHQLDSLKNMDRQARDEYLHTEPKGIDASLKSHDIARRILDQWAA